MDDEIFWTFLGIAGAFWFLVAPLLGAAAWHRTRGLERRLRALETQAASEPAAAAAPTGFLSRNLDDVAVPAAEAGAAMAISQPAPEAAAAVNAAAPPPEMLAPVPHAAELESRFVQRWLVWLGAGILALGGIFAASYAAESGFLGPTARIVLTALLGLALVGVAFRLQPHATPGRFDPIAAALAAGGLVTLYAATAAAYALYGLVAELAALGVLLLVSAAGLSLGRRFGPLTGVLGVLGAYLAPALVASAEPSAWSLFLYLGLVAALTDQSARRSGWAWLAWLNLCLFAGWTLVGLIVANAANQSEAVALAALLAGGSAIVSLTGLPGGPRLRIAGRALLAWACLSLVAGLLVGDYAAGTLILAAALLLLTTLLAYYRDTERWLASLAAATALLAAAAWSIPAIIDPRTELYDPAVALEPLLWIVPEARPLLAGLAAMAVAFAVVGLMAERRRPAFGGYWAGLAAGVPLAALGVAYWRLEGFGISPRLALVALALAGCLLLAAERALRRRARTALGSHAVGMLAALALAAVMVFDAATLTVALALQLPAVAWVARRLQLPRLRPAAAILVAVLLLRAWWWFETGDQPTPWPALLLEVGIPGLACLAARLLFGSFTGRWLAPVLEGAALAFWIMLLAIGMALLLPAAGPTAALLRLAALNGFIAATGLGLLRLQQRASSSFVLRIGGPLLLGYAALDWSVRGLVEFNPILVDGETVGPWPLLDALLPAYAVPAVLAFATAAHLTRAGHAVAARMAETLAALMALTWVSLETLRLLQGPSLTWPASEGQSLALSVAWLVAAAILLGAGIGRADRNLRSAALAIAGIAVLKAFLFDLGGLGGLYRAASFLGLGLSLIGVAWLYQRFVSPPPTPQRTAPTTS